VIPLHEIEFDRVLTLIAMEAKSAPGKDAVARRRPLATFEECERAQAELAEMVRFYHREGLLPISGLTDVRPLFDRETVLELDESWLIVRAAARQRSRLREDVPPQRYLPTPQEYRRAHPPTSARC